MPDTNTWLLLRTARSEPSLKISALSRIKPAPRSPDNQSCVGEIVTKTLKQHGYAEHPAVAKCNLPMMSAAEFAALRVQVRKSPRIGAKLIKDREGQVLDGRMRLAAWLLEKGERPPSNSWRVVEVKNEKHAMVIIAEANVIRRHLTSSQIAMIVAGLERRGVDLPIKHLKRMGTSETAVSRARVVRNYGDEKLQDEVKSGKISVDKAARIATGRIPVDEEDDQDEGGENRARSGTGEEVKQKRPGRPAGNSWVVAFKHALGKLAKLKDHASVIQSVWQPKEKELKEAEASLKAAQAIVTAVRKRTGSRKVR